MTLLISLVIFTQCKNDTASPKPRGYFRLTPPQTEYAPLNSNCPYTFEINTSAEWQKSNKAPCWGDVYYPTIRARLQLTYKSIKNPEDLPTFLEDGRDLAYKHVVKAEGIREQLFSYADKNVHGIYYTIAGDAASSTQFVATDSTNHFMRGVLYFYSAPNADSLKPVTTFMQNEILHLIETLEWQQNL